MRAESAASLGLRFGTRRHVDRARLRANQRSQFFGALIQGAIGSLERVVDLSAASAAAFACDLVVRARHDPTEFPRHFDDRVGFFAVVLVQDDGEFGVVPTGQVTEAGAFRARGAQHGVDVGNLQ